MGKERDQTKLYGIVYFICAFIGNLSIGVRVGKLACSHDRHAGKTDGD